jgi:hypothetical protein
MYDRYKWVRGLDGAGRDVDEYKRASARTFRHILVNCTLLLTLTGLRQRLPDPVSFFDSMGT